MSRGISKDGLLKYYDSLFYKPRVIAFIKEANSLQRNKYQAKMISQFIPTVSFQSVPGGGYKVTDKAAGVCHGCSHISVADWVLVDKTEAKVTMRHELAHALQHYKYGASVKPHGKEFIEALKAVSPNNWRRDRHYRETPFIVKARSKALKQRRLKLIKQRNLKKRVGAKV